MAIADLGKARREASYVERMLSRMDVQGGLRGAIAQVARLIRDHAQLERLLTDTPPNLRQELYDAIRPNLRFVPKPLDVYIAQAGQRAEREKLPTVAGDGSLRPFAPAHDLSTAERAIAASLAKRSLTLLCAQCTREETFYGVGEDTNVDVVLKARRAGWVYDYKSDPPREICPQCPTSLRPNPGAFGPAATQFD